MSRGREVGRTLKVCHGELNFVAKVHEELKLGRKWRLAVKSLGILGDELVLEPVGSKDAWGFCLLIYWTASGFIWGFSSLASLVA